MKTWHGYLGLMLALGLALLWSCAAHAQMCRDRAGLVESLKASFGEVPAGMGSTGNGAVIELLASPKGSWSMIISMPDGRACLIATGDGWESFPPKPGKDARASSRVERLGDAIKPKVP